jgi:membrane-associated phospholipid phosphatase
MTRCRTLAAALVATIGLAQEPTATTGRIDMPGQIPGLAVTDLKATWTAPAGWTAETWQRLGIGAAALVGLSLALDRPVDRGVRRSNLSSFDPWAKRLDTLGGTGTIAVAGGAYLGGLLADQPKVREFGADAAFAMLVAQVGIVYPAKYLVGRSRPTVEAGPASFTPLRGDPSFPSAHAAQAFTLATVISAYADNPWASAAAYGGATLVGLARIEQRAHFVSDVAAGAAIGVLSAKAVMLRHRTLRLAADRRVDLSCAPVWNGNRAGLQVRVQF